MEPTRVDRWTYWDIIFGEPKDVKCELWECLFAQLVPSWEVEGFLEGVREEIDEERELNERGGR